MGKARAYPHLHTVRRKTVDGSTVVHRYHRKTRVRIDGEPGTQEFLVSYASAAQRHAPDRCNTLDQLVDRYKRSDKFGKLANRTQRDYDRKFLIILREWNGVPIKAFDDRRMRQDIKCWHKKLAVNSKKQADYALTVLKLLLEFGIGESLLDDNYATKIDLVYKADRTDNIWADELIEQFRSKASNELSLALLLALHTGQRQGDLLKLTWAAYDGYALTLRQSKSGRQVYLPCTNTLKRSLGRTPKRAVTILTNSRGLTWTESGFRSSWRTACAAAGIVGVTFNDLRGTAVTWFAEAGCTVPEIAAITGHSLKSVEAILERYLSRTKGLSRNAIGKFENFVATKSVNVVVNGANLDLDETSDVFERKQ